MVRDGCVWFGGTPLPIATEWPSRREVIVLLQGRWHGQFCSATLDLSTYLFTNEAARPILLQHALDRAAVDFLKIKWPPYAQ